MLKYINNKLSNFYNSPFKPSQPNLALTPSQIERNTLDGLPSSTGMLSDDMLIKGDTSIQVNLPSEYQRGYTIEDAWNDCQTGKSKLRSIHKQFNTLLANIQIPQPKSK